MKLIKTETDFYCEDDCSNGAIISVNEEWLQDEGALMIRVKRDFEDTWLSPLAYKDFLTKIIESITELEILYGTQKINDCN